MLSHPRLNKLTHPPVEPAGPQPFKGHVSLRIQDNSTVNSGSGVDSAKRNRNIGKSWNFVIIAVILADRALYRT